MKRQLVDESVRRFCSTWAIRLDDVVENSTELNRVSWSLMDSHEVLWSLIEPYGVSLSFMGFSIEPYGVSWSLCISFGVRMWTCLNFISRPDGRLEKSENRQFSTSNSRHNRQRVAHSDHQQLESRNSAYQAHLKHLKPFAFGVVFHLKSFSMSSLVFVGRSFAFACIPLHSLVFPCIPLHSLAFACHSPPFSYHSSTIRLHSSEIENVLNCNSPNWCAPPNWKFIVWSGGSSFARSNQSGTHSSFSLIFPFTLRGALLWPLQIQTLDSKRRLRYKLQPQVAGHPQGIRKASTSYGRKASSHKLQSKGAQPQLSVERNPHAAVERHPATSYGSQSRDWVLFANCLCGGSP